MVRIGDHGLQALHVSRDVVDEGGKLVRKHRRDENKRAREYDHEAEENDKRGNQPAHAALDEPVGERIEQVGKSRPDHEGQEDVVQ